ncbi:hypothetical protein AAFF_G00307250 [Aldrovandia affinis]|uniref:Uncharacterized protein n=1 Tax=Aldrovandia affinis TaxID=143900 RepID=A0AAD7R8R8_9TELE|nr:hypothetical protein AAFF_G00307250 [Aldrovandia affinis]
MRPTAPGMILERGTHVAMVAHPGACKMAGGRKQSQGHRKSLLADSAPLPAGGLRENLPGVVSDGNPILGRTTASLAGRLKSADLPSFTRKRDTSTC